MALFLSKRNIYVFFFKLDFVITWRIYRAKMDFFVLKCTWARSHARVVVRLFCHSFLVLIFFNPLSCDNNSNIVNVLELNLISGSL